MGAGGARRHMAGSLPAAPQAPAPVFAASLVRLPAAGEPDAQDSSDGPPGHKKKWTSTPTPAPTATRTPAATATSSRTPTATPSRTPAASSTATAAATATRTRTATATAVATATAASTPTASVVVPAPATDWIRADGTRLVDSLGRQLTPRGFVTVTNNSAGSAVEYTVDDFRRMRAMGANHHVLRVHGGLLGAAPDWSASPYYLDRIDTAVARAKEAGLYTVLKMTMYDLALFGLSGWGSFWANQNGEQAAVLDAWRLLWERYKDEPAVLGYDLLNEPEPGTLATGNSTFVASYLTPFYRSAIDALRTIDQRHLALFQPPKSWPMYPTPLERPQAVYAPHYYPNLLDYLYQGVLSTSQYAPLLQSLEDQAQQLGVPLLIGEYGMPWFAENDGDAALEGQFAAQEKLARDLMDASGIGFTRPWYADDRAAYFWAEQGILLNWALFRGESGLGGPERRFITDVVVRPYPQAVAGTAGGFSYDQATRRLVLTYTPAAARGRTDVHVPRLRHYAAGFLVRYTGGLVLAYDASAPSGLRVVENPGGLNAGAFAWDEARQVLTVREWLTGQPVTLEVLPN
jgi:hypothetical protein